MIQFNKFFNTFKELKHTVDDYIGIKILGNPN